MCCSLRACVGCARRGRQPEISACPFWLMKRPENLTEKKRKKAEREILDAMEDIGHPASSKEIWITWRSKDGFLSQ